MKATPGDYVSLPIKKTLEPCGIKDVVDFIFDYINSDLVGLIAISHLRFSDLDNPHCTNCLKLAELASQAVDFPKTGTPVKFEELPRQRDRVRPDFLAREGADLDSEMFYNSQKLLGQLFRRVPVKEWMPREWSEFHTPSGGEIIERALRRCELYGLGLSLAAPSAELQEEMGYLLDDYCEQLLAIARTHTMSKNKDIYVTEPELLSGTIMANWTDQHRRREAVNAMNLQIAETFKRAWAAWCAAESMLREEPASYGPQSFGLIALGRMLELIRAMRSLV
ncbi:RNA dependent RNA polymerase-domain-containing protein [Butyriboletus roseoflavus]|nr:RNA dependent RNA polymerase-domain-containing protein [Butyriboletus roseoflavus]